MKLLCILIVFIVLISSVHGFRLVHQSNSLQYSRLHSSTVELDQAYGQILRKATESIEKRVNEGKVPPFYLRMLTDFMKEYAESSLEVKLSSEEFATNVLTFLKSIENTIENPFKFEPFHKSIRQPFDYYKWGNDFLRPLVIQEQSNLFGVETAQEINEACKRGENVVILSNHQTEVDPQVLSILLEKYGLNELAERIIFIAGHKVTNDPVAVPFSMGRNLICIHSKKHIKNPPEDAAKKQAQNLESVKEMTNLMSEGGKVFWVAPSGGRDRPDPVTGKFVVSPFDMKALDMFKLIAIQSKKTTNFYPLSMYTHTLIPPPKSVSSDLGESRSGKRGAVSVKFLSKTPGLGGLKDKEFTNEVQKRVEDAYAELVKFHESFLKE